MKDLENYIEVVLGVPHTSPQVEKMSGGWSSPVESMDYAGYASVYGAMLFLSVEASEKAQQCSLPFPDQCCVCGEPASCYLPLAALSIAERWRRLFGKNSSPEIPHCLSHGNRPTAQFLIQVFPRSKGLVIVECYGLNYSFLKSFYLSCIQGEMSPPWIEFPSTLPGLGWNQGSKENWMHLAWLPFWNSLSHAQRQEYLMRWNAPAHWREALTEPFGEWQLVGIRFDVPTT